MAVCGVVPVAAVVLPVFPAGKYRRSLERLLLTVLTRVSARSLLNGWAIRSRIWHRFSYSISGSQRFNAFTTGNPLWDKITSS